MFNGSEYPCKSVQVRGVKNTREALAHQDFVVRRDSWWSMRRARVKSSFCSPSSGGNASLSPLSASITAGAATLLPEFFSPPRLTHHRGGDNRPREFLVVRRNDDPRRVRRGGGTNRLLVSSHVRTPALAFGQIPH